jgi:glycosyltransferase involved in cell wall biosynthesis
VLDHLPTPGGDAQVILPGEAEGFADAEDDRATEQDLPKSHEPMVSPVMPRVSCLMPTADRPEMAKKAVLDFMAQSYRDSELVILDDGDPPFRLAMPPGHRVRLIRTEKRTSLYAKRERGIRLAKGELLVFWDDDDIHGPDRVKVQVAELDKGFEATYFDQVLALVNGVLWESPKGILPPGTLACTRAFHARGGIEDTGIGSEARFINAKPRSVARRAPDDADDRSDLEAD